MLKEDGDSANTMERLRTIANLLNGKIERVRQLDSEILDLCDVSVIVQEIEESEDVYSRACDVQARIAKLTCRSVETISKYDVQVHETTNTGQNADAHNEPGQSIQFYIESIDKRKYHAEHGHATSQHEHATSEHEHANSALGHVNTEYEHAIFQYEHKFDAASAYSSEIKITQVNSPKI